MKNAVQMALTALMACLALGVSLVVVAMEPDVPAQQTPTSVYHPLDPHPVLCRTNPDIICDLIV